FTPGIYHEDEEFTPRLMLKAKNIYATKSEAYFYRQRSNSIINNKSHAHTDKRLKDILGVIIHLREIALQVEPEQKKALNRRVSQLTMDYLYNIIHLTHSHKQFNGAIEELKKQQLYPLSTMNYSRKYTLFRKMIETKVGRIFLLTFIK
ncbi:MAG: glycosyltransferase family 2 protein, partial [Prevotella sp.]